MPVKIQPQPLPLFFRTSHIIPNPAGTFSVKGSVPSTCLRYTCPPTAQQAMAGRVVKVEDVNYGWDTRTFPTRQEAEAAVIEGGGTLCDCCK